VVREGRDSGVAMMAAAAEHGSGGRQWGQWATTAMAENNSGGQQMRRMMATCKVEWQTMRGKEEGRQKTTTALGQEGHRECETNKEIKFTQKDFFQQYRLSSWNFCSRQKQTPFLLDLSVLYHLIGVCVLQ
jgi:hypothetical protein